MDTRIFRVLLYFLLLCTSSCSASERFLCDDACSMSNASVCKQDVDPSKEEILLLGLFPCNATDFAAIGITVAGQMAVKKINSDAELLSDYSLRLVVEDVECKSLPAVRSLINNIKPDINTTVRMIIGTGCSSGARVVSPLSNSWNLTMVSFTASDPALSDKTHFPNFVRTVSSDKATVAAVKKLISHYNWKQLAIITDSSVDLLNSVKEIFEKTRDDSFILYTFDFSDDGGRGLQLQSAQNSGAKVIFLNVFEENARHVLCKAHSMGMFYPEYLWLTYGWFTEGWQVISNIGCTQDQINTVLYRSIAINHFPVTSLGQEDRVTDVGYTTNEFLSTYKDQVTELYGSGEDITQGLYVYDAVWLAAHMLDASLQMLKSKYNIVLADLSYENRTLADRLINDSRTIKFQGVSGKVELDANGDRTGDIRIEQYRYPSPNAPNVSLVQFARVTENNTITFEPIESDASVWPQGVLKDYEENFIDLWLFCVMAIFSGIGIIFAICCIVFDVLLRNKQAVRLTSPALNIFIVLGIILLFLDVVVLGLDRGITGMSIGAFCMLSMWLASAAFTLIFGPLFAKTFRVYWIWSRSQKMYKARPLKNWILLCFVGVLLIVDLVILTIVTAVDATRLELVVRQILRMGTGLVPIQVEVCTAEYANVWIGIFLGYKGVLLLLGVFLAIQTWNVKLKHINDSHLITVSIIMVFVGSVVAVVLAYLLLEMVDVAFGLVAAICLLIGYFILCLLYIPKMGYMIKHHDGEVFRSEDHTSATTTAKPSTMVNTDRLKQIRAEISETKAKIAELKKSTNGASLKDAESTHDSSYFPNRSISDTSL